jgi:hypothetical protein
MTTWRAPDDVVTIRYAGILARPGLRELADLAARYPRSYSRDRVMAEADAILDAALDEAADGVAKFPASSMPKCVVCDDLGCEYCPKV